MSFHRNAKLGLAGRYALVQAIASGMSLKQAAAAFSVSGDGSSLVAPLVGRKRGGARDSFVSA
jgi:hypothetical protein